MKIYYTLCQTWNGWSAWICAVGLRGFLPLVCADFCRCYGGMDSTKVESRTCREGHASPSWVRNARLLRMLRQPNEGEPLPVLIHNPDAVTQGQSGPRSRDALSGDDMGARAAEDINAKMNRLDYTITSVAATVGELAEIVRELQSRQTKERRRKGRVRSRKSLKGGGASSKRSPRATTPCYQAMAGWGTKGLMTSWAGPRGMSITSSLGVLGAEPRPLVLSGGWLGMQPIGWAGWHATACSRRLTASSITRQGRSIALITQGRDNFAPNAGQYFAMFLVARPSR